VYPAAGAASKAYWDGAVRHGYGTGPGELGFQNTDWAVMINTPGEAAAGGAGQCWFTLKQAQTVPLHKLFTG
jgi:hypothetical protein